MKEALINYINALAEKNKPCVHDWELIDKRNVVQNVTEGKEPEQEAVSTATTLTVPAIHQTKRVLLKKWLQRL